MKNFVVCFFFLFITSCAFKGDIVYLNNIQKFNESINYDKVKNYIEIGDILKIDVITLVPEASAPFNITSEAQNIDLLKLQGFVVDNEYLIDYPHIGKVNVRNTSMTELEDKISNLLLENNQLTSPVVKVSRINSKFTILGEVNAPGTFSYFDTKINLFQAIGYANDLNINADRKNILLVRETNGVRKVYELDLNDSKILEKPYYYIKNNDVLIIPPNYSKINRNTL